MTEEQSKALGEALREVREMAGKSLKAVAEPAEISPAYLAETGEGRSDVSVTARAAPPRPTCWELITSS